MEKTTVTTYGRVLQPSRARPKKKFELSISTKTIRQLLLCALAISCGHMKIFKLFYPMGIAYGASFFLEGYEFYIMLGCAALGFFTGSEISYYPKYTLCFFLMLLFELVFSTKLKKLEHYQRAILGGVSIFMSGAILAVIPIFSVYQLFVCATEGILVTALSYIMTKGVHLLKNGGLSRKILSDEEMISLAVIVGLGITGLSGFEAYGLSFKTMGTVFLILLSGYRGGACAGTAVGVLMGFLTLIVGEGSLPLFCLYGITGLFCGCLNTMGRMVCFLCFLISGCMVAFYMNEELLTVGLLYSTLAGGAAFLIVPNKFFSFIHSPLCTEKWDEQEYKNRVKTLTTEKLKSFSEAFKALARTFTKRTKKTDEYTKTEVSELVDQMAAKVCNKCGLSAYCWQTDFYNTYQTVFSVLSECEKKGFVTLEDLPEKFRESCVHRDLFVSVFNRYFELYKLNRLWENKIEESRDLVSQQLYSVADIIDGLSVEVNKDVTFHESIEKDIKIRLDQLKIIADRVSVMESDSHEYEVWIEFKQEYSRKKIILVINSVSAILGRKMRRELIPERLQRSKRFRIKLVEEEKLRLSTGIAMLAKEENGVSGDCYSFLELKDGSFLMAVSDGMGSGEKANSQSNAVIDLLERFAECGFEKDMALKLINSVLVLKSTEDTFSTLDLCSINLYSGKGEFIKVGGACAFLVRDGEVKVIRSHNLPVGVVKNLDIEKIPVAFKPDDMIIMVTDGVTDCIDMPEGEWIRQLFSRFQSRNPQDMADYILIEARKAAKGGIKDDMTVFVGRLWQKASF